MAWMSDPTVKLALLCFSLGLLLDIGMRIKPNIAEVSPPGIGEYEDIFVRLKPNADWTAWYESLKASEARDASKVRDEQDKKALAEAKVAEEQAALARERAASLERRQEGDLSVLQVGKLEYRLWGVFNKVAKPGTNDTFGVLESKSGRALQVRVDDVVGGAYRVVELTSRAVVFESIQDDRKLKLWLFGKGPR